MKRLAFLLFICAALPLHAQEGTQHVRVYSDCTASIIFQLPETPPIHIASSQDYDDLSRAYPEWLHTIAVQHQSDGRTEIRLTNALPEHGTELLLVQQEAEDVEVYQQIELPPCQKPTARTAEQPLHDVQHGDTLIEISLLYYRELDVDLNTLMLAIQSFNRRSFLSDNINLLRADLDVVIPSKEDIAHLSLSPEYVRTEVARQNTRWRQFKAGEIDRTALRMRPLRLSPLGTKIVQNTSAPTATASAQDESPPQAQMDAGKISIAPAEVADNTVPEDESIPEPEVSETASRTERRQTDEVKSDTAEDSGIESPPLDEQNEAVAPTIPDSGDGTTVYGIHALWFAFLSIAAILGGLYLALLVLRRYRRARLIRESITEDPTNAKQKVSSMLDLARAHIEMGNPKLALPFVEEVLTRGNPEEREEARQLRARIMDN